MGDLLQKIYQEMLVAKIVYCVHPNSHAFGDKCLACHAFVHVPGTGLSVGICCPEMLSRHYCEPYNILMF